MIPSLRLDFLDRITGDLRYAARGLRKSPAFTLGIVLVLALGIGANTAIFSLMDRVFLSPLPYLDADRIVQLALTYKGQFDSVIVSLPEYVAFLRDSGVVEETAAYDFGGPGVNITEVDDPEQVKAIHVSAGYFRLFGAHAALGRTFTKEEDLPGGPRAAVLSNRLWTSRFHADPNIVGRAISLGKEPVVVAGVLSADFRPDLPADIWLPLQPNLDATSQAHFLRAAARLRPGVTLQQANARMAVLTAEFRTQYPLFSARMGMVVQPLRDTSSAPLRRPLFVLLATVVLVLLIACSNVANLLLVRASARQGEMAIRAAIGATSGRITAQLLTESLLLALLGGGAGLALSRMALWGFGLFELSTTGFGVPDLNGRVLAFTLTTSLAALLVFGWIPARDASRSGSVQAGERVSASRSRQRLKSALVVVQLGLAVLLVISAGLMLRTLDSIRHVDPGLDPRNILTMEMSLNGTQTSSAETVGKLVRAGVERLEMLPGVEAAATSWTLPVESAFGSAFVIEGRPLGPEMAHGGALMRPVSPSYASVFRIPILRGRFFNNRDTAEAPAVAVISNAMARKFWPDADPLGQRILVDQHLGPDFASAPRTIVGIAGDVLDTGLTKKAQPLIYEPQAQAPNGMTRIDTSILPITWSIRTVGDPHPMSVAIQRELRQASGGLPVSHTRTMEEVMSESTSATRLQSVLLGSFGIIALLLAGAGLYGLVAYSVHQRKREMAIRLAVGATPSRVRKMVLAQGARLTGIGLVLGVGASVGLTRFLSSLIFGVKPVDAEVILVSGLLLGGVALLAAYLPARRASEVDPMSSLRE